MAVRMFAAIEIGSFALELGIYEISEKTGIRCVDHIRHVIALGSDTFSEGKISYGLADEMCSVLEDFTGIMKTYRVREYRAYGTTAMREAKNSQIILDQIRVRTGLKVRIISNSEQRFISYKAVAAKTGEFNRIIQKGTAIVDVGFGSAQISLFDKDTLVTTQSLPLGTLRIRSQLAKIPASVRSHCLHIEELVDNELITFRKMYLKDRKIDNLIGIGTNITYLMRQLGLNTAADRVDAKEMELFYERLSQMTLDQIEERFNVNSRVMEVTGAGQFWIPDIGLCDGIAAEYANDCRLLRFSHSFENDILAAARNMAKRYKCHAGHNQMLEQYALSIFDTARKFHGMGARERLLLQIAVTLHGCGKVISIRNEIIANAVRYNIRDFDYDTIQLETQIGEDGSGNLNRSAITILIAKLTAILRLANSMDKTHKSKLADCRMAIREGELVITTGYTGDLALERASFEQKADFFEEIFGIRPVLKQKRRA